MFGMQRTLTRQGRPEVLQRCLPQCLQQPETGKLHQLHAKNQPHPEKKPFDFGGAKSRRKNHDLQRSDGKARFQL